MCVRRTIDHAEFGIVGDDAEEFDVRAHPRGSGSGLDACRRLRFGVQGLAGCVADDQQHHVGSCCNDTRQTLCDEFAQALAGAEAADGEQQRTTGKAVTFPEIDRGACRLRCAVVAATGFRLLPE